MPSYAHSKLIQQILNLDVLPSEPVALNQWVQAGQHLQFLRDNTLEDEIVFYAAGPYSFVHSIVVPNRLLTSDSPEELLGWSCNPYTSIASYCYGGGRGDVWIEREEKFRGSEILNGGRDLVFGRTFEGWNGSDRDYFEINQEYTHLMEIHWRQEHNAYCKFDENGDLQHAVSISLRDDDDSLTLVSFDWRTLETYLAIADCSLVRMFDFTLLDRRAFSHWPEGPEDIVHESERFLYRQKIAGESAYTRGVQIIGVERSVQEIMSEFKTGGASAGRKNFVEFIAQDWRNGCISKISTDPLATTNYFQAKENNLPYELSPVFFRPEVLSKYKTDREKYKVGDRDISCRSSWYLRGYDVNKAGQVHAYICDLRNLPYQEQLHWLGYNEPPKESISERAFTTDFKGEFATYAPPRQTILSILRNWQEQRVDWWKLRDRDLLNRANPPLTSSKDEWGDAMMDLSKLIIEGFDVKTIRKKLDDVSVTYEAKEMSIALLEKYLSHRLELDETVQLSGLRTIQTIRTKVKGHASGSASDKIAKEAISTHGSFAKHFDYICEMVVAELEMIERTISKQVEES